VSSAAFLCYSKDCFLAEVFDCDDFASPYIVDWAVVLTSLTWKLGKADSLNLKEEMPTAEADVMIGTSSSFISLSSSSSDEEEDDSLSTFFSTLL
jgi:hypothetical protein